MGDAFIQHRHYFQATSSWCTISSVSSFSSSSNWAVAESGFFSHSTSFCILVDLISRWMKIISASTNQRRPERKLQLLGIFLSATYVVASTCKHHSSKFDCVNQIGPVPTQVIFWPIHSQTTGNKDRSVVGMSNLTTLLKSIMRYTINIIHNVDEITYS